MHTHHPHIIHQNKHKKSSEVVHKPIINYHLTFGLNSRLCCPTETEKLTTADVTICAARGEIWTDIMQKSRAMFEKKALKQHTLKIICFFTFSLGNDHLKSIKVCDTLKQNIFGLVFKICQPRKFNWNNKGDFMCKCVWSELWWIGVLSPWSFP